MIMISNKILHNGKMVYHSKDGLPSFIKIIKEYNEPKDTVIKYHQLTKYHRYGKLHREDGPAIIYEIGISKFKEIWYRNGKKHRLDGPADIQYSLKNDIRYDNEERWYRNGKQYRLDGPAYTIKNPKGELKLEIWYENGSCGRLDGHSKIEYRRDSRIFHYGKTPLHNDKGPVMVEYDLNGDMISELWMQYGKKHRIDGPAITIRRNGDITYNDEYWIINGEDITNDVHHFIEEMKIPSSYNDWNNDTKFLFKMLFG